MRAIVGMAALLLAGCGGGDSGQIDVSEVKDEASAAVALGKAAAGNVSATNLPDFVAMYRGATPSLNMRQRDKDGEVGGMFAYTVKADVADVLAFHRGLADKAGISFDTEMQMGTGLTLAGRSKDEAMTLALTLGTDEDSGEVTVTQTYADKRGRQAAD
jgi:hypothetical protein